MPPYVAGAMGAAVVLVIGAGTWFAVGRPGTSSASTGANQAGRVAAAAGQVGPAASGPASDGPGTTAPAATAPAAGPVTPSPSPSPSRTSPTGPVTESAAVAGKPDAPRIVTYLDQYFTAINKHDYQGYMALRGPQMSQGLTESEFDTGYAGTKDSDEILVGISSAPNGDSVGEVSFTSHQSAAESPTGTTCNKWDISLYLAPDGDSYLMDNPPSSYKSKYLAC